MNEHLHSLSYTCFTPENQLDKDVERRCQADGNVPAIQNQAYFRPNPSLSYTAPQSFSFMARLDLYRYNVSMLKHVLAVGNRPVSSPRQSIRIDNDAGPVTGIRSLPVIKIKSFRWSC